LVSEESIQLNQSQALYDVNVAVLRIIGLYENQTADLTYESYTYCNFYMGYLAKFSQCYLSEDFRQLSPSQRISSTYFVYLNETDLQLADFLVPGPNATAPLDKPLFNVLIIPDIIAAEKDLIIDIIGDQGLQTIRDFVNNGGTVYSSAKGIYILEAAGLINSGTTDTGKLTIFVVLSL
jgi:hypothetical protein